MSNAKYARVRVGPLAGKPATSGMLIDVPRLVTAYYTDVPDSSVREQRVAFGTSGHRGSAVENTFNQWHVLAISQAICDYRKRQGIGGPLAAQRDPEMRSSKKGNQWYFGMKAHIGVDARSGLVHTAGVTSGSVHDATVMAIRATPAAPGSARPRRPACSGR
jgi:hypothetical protein